MNPNLVFVFADQMRGMDMGCAGNLEVHTPNMDRLAAEGLRFTQAYANTPVCGPSRASLVTGMHPVKHGVIANDLELPAEAPSIGKRLKASGYETGWIGKWHLDRVGRKWTEPGDARHGFDYWAVWATAHRYFKPEKYHRDLPEPVVAEGYDPVIQTDLALDFIRQAQGPFALFLSWGPPHDPYDQVPEAYLEMYDPERLTLRPNVATDTPYLEKNGKHLAPRTTLAQYYAAITALDAQLGRIMEVLEETHLSQETILVFASDHGDMLFSQGTLYKQKPFEESIAIPFLIRYPGRLPAGESREQLLGVVDICPTLLGLMGLEALEVSQGRDLSPVLMDGGLPGPEAVLISNTVSAFEGRRYPLPEWRGIRTQRYTYTRLVDGTAWHLFDNETDPYQLTNVAGRQEWLSVQEELDALLSRLLAEAGDPFLNGPELITFCELVERWNERERMLHPNDPHLIQEEGRAEDYEGLNY